MHTTAHDEERWLTEEAGLLSMLNSAVETHLQRAPVEAGLLARLRKRVLTPPGHTGGSPALFAVRMARSLGASQERVDAAGIFCTLLWAAADVADDIDDGDAPGARANDACALLMLAHRAAAAITPEILEAALHFGLIMAGGQNRDLDATDRPRVPDTDAIHLDKAGAEFALFFAVAARAADRPTRPFEAFGLRFGAALQDLSDVFDVYLKPRSGDFIAGKWTRVLAPLYGKRPFRLLASRLRSRPDVQAEMRFQAAASAMIALQDAEFSVREAWARLIDDVTEASGFEPAVAWFLATAATIRETLGMLDRPRALPALTPENGVERALAYLEEATGAAEVHRWGLFGKPRVRADLYPAIFRLAALQAWGRPAHDEWEKLQRLRDPDGWRYYPHERTIPPDADDTGLVLGYFGARLAAEIRAADTALLLDNLVDEGVRTWMGPSPEGIVWQGNDCPGTAANAIWGLLEQGQAERIPPGAWKRLCGVAERGEFEGPFYVAPLTRWFVHRVLAQARRHGFIDEASAQSVCQTLEAELRAEERLDGSYGGVLETIAAVLAARCWSLPVDGQRIAAWLLDRQTIDGSWPGEAAFVSIDRDYLPACWGHPVLTTAWALLACAPEGKARA